MSESIELQVNLNTLVRDGWSVEMETGMRGGQVRSWVKLRHFERGLLFKVRSAPMELKDALAAAMREAGIEPFLHWRADETSDPLASHRLPGGHLLIDCPGCDECTGPEDSPCA